MDADAGVATVAEPALGDGSVNALADGAEVGAAPGGRVVAKASDADKGAAAVERVINQEWEESEDAEPTDPYSVLGVSRQESLDVIQERFDHQLAYYERISESRQSTAGQEVVDGDAGQEATRFSRQQSLDDSDWLGQRLMVARARRAFFILSDAEERKKYDEHRKARIQGRSWTRIRYANGIYEGGVDPKSMQGKLPEPVRSKKGVMVLETGEKHEGVYVDDHKHGIGLHLWKNGDFYIGQWKNDKIAGKGCYHYSSGVRYSGDFLDGKKHGKGYLKWNCDSAYAGQFVSGHRSGRGVLELPKDEFGEPIGRYTGQWDLGDFSGHGVFELKGTGVYEGEFLESRFHGEGTLKLANGDTNEGSFSKGAIHGEVLYKWLNGDEYSGPIRHGHREGFGTFTSVVRKLKLNGTWSNDELQGSGAASWEHLHEDAETQSGMYSYKGQWEEGMMDGKGLLVEPNGTKCKGNFSRNQKHGYCEIVWPDGSTFSCEFDRDLQDGEGIFTGPRTENGVPAYTKKEMWKRGKISDSEFTETFGSVPSISDFH